jgi:ABC-type nitrate/sulfonate/bicarbonate transport system substrate-binding protein
VEIRVFRNTTEAFNAAQGGQIHCVALFPPEQLQAERLNFNMLYDVSKDRVLYPSGSTYTSKKMIKEHPDIVLAYMKAISEGIAVYKTDPDFAVSTYQKWTKLDDLIAIKSGWEWFSRDMPDIPRWSPDAMKMTLGALTAEIEKAKTVEPTSLYDNSFIEQLEKEGFYAQLEKQYSKKK